jgi:hypothetical protein
VDCINSDRIAALENFNAAVLCSYAQNDNPLTCFNNSSLSLFDNEAAVLCQGSTSPSSANACYEATPLDLAEPDAATLCSQSEGGGAAPRECWAQTPVSLPSASAAILCQRSVSPSTTVSCWENSPSYLTDHEAAILCSGSESSAAANQCMAATSTNMSNIEAAYLCSGARNARPKAAVECYNTTSVNLSEYDAAVLCSGNTGLLTSMYAINTQYTNRAIGGGAGGKNPGTGLAAFGDLSKESAYFFKGQDPAAKRTYNTTARRGAVAAAKSRRANLASIFFAKTKKMGPKYEVTGSRKGTPGASRADNQKLRVTLQTRTLTPMPAKPKLQ